MARTFLTTEQDMVAAFQLHYTMSRAKAVWTIGAFALGVVAYIAAKNAYAATLAGGAAGLAIAQAAIRYLVVPNRAKRLYQQQKNLRSEFELSWDDQVLHIRSQDYNENLRWADLAKAKENEAMVLLYRSDYNLSIIPKRCFSSAEDYAQFRSHLVPRLLG
ncbi:YcxB family protein [Ralstonia sp. 24A2]|uniref:YcxB family protein n=1 Tax=Ralstonia sp. 24A2 TaxID=3447364 RepID=UPI003F6A50F2